MRVGHKSRVKRRGQVREPGREKANGPADGGGEGTSGGFIGKLCMPSCFGPDIKHAFSRANEMAQGHTGASDIQGTEHLYSSDRRIWILMDTYGA
jgi:hypothetical protein